jgi:hypothetical protein
MKGFLIKKMQDIEKEQSLDWKDSWKREKSFPRLKAEASNSMEVNSCVPKSTKHRGITPFRAYEQERDRMGRLLQPVSAEASVSKYAKKSRPLFEELGNLLVGEKSTFKNNSQVGFTVNSTNLKKTRNFLKLMENIADVTKIFQDRKKNELPKRREANFRSAQKEEEITSTIYNPKFDLVNKRIPNFLFKKSKGRDERQKIDDKQAIDVERSYALIFGRGTAVPLFGRMRSRKTLADVKVYKKRDSDGLNAQKVERQVGELALKELLNKGLCTEGLRNRPAGGSECGDEASTRPACQDTRTTVGNYVVLCKEGTTMAWESISEASLTNIN